MPEEDITVSVEDDSDAVRKLSDYKPTNSPLSNSEIKQDEARDTGHEGWAPRTTENIGDLTPLPERPAEPRP